MRDSEFYFKLKKNYPKLFKKGKNNTHSYRELMMDVGYKQPIEENSWHDAWVYIIKNEHLHDLWML